MYFCTRQPQGKMPEWSNGPHSKCGERVTAPWVRIPVSPLNVLDRNGQQTDKKLQINDLWLFFCPKVLLPRLQKYGKRQSFVTKSLPIPRRTKTVTICPQMT